MVIDEHATRRWPDKPRANNLYLQWRRTRNEDVTSRNFKPRVCFLLDLSRRRIITSVWLDLVRREKDEEDGEGGIDDTHAARVVFVFIQRGGYSWSKLSSLWADSGRNLSELDRWMIIFCGMLGLFVEYRVVETNCSDDSYLIIYDREILRVN